jgi:hypothetical protein
MTRFTVLERDGWYTPVVQHGTGPALTLTAQVGLIEASAHVLDRWSGATYVPEAAWSEWGRDRRRAA